MIPLDAICRILQAAGEPLHYSDIAQRLINRNDWSPQSNDPSRLLDQYICEYIRETPRERRRIQRFEPGIYEVRSDPAKSAFESHSMPLPAAHVRNREVFIQVAISVFETRLGELLHYAELTRLAISYGLISGEHKSMAKAMLIHLRDAAQRAQRYPRWRKTLTRRQRYFYVIVDHGNGVFSFSPVNQISNTASISSLADGLSEKQLSGNTRTPRKRPKIRNRGMLPGLPYADAACQVLIRWSKRKPMHFRMIAKKAVELSLVRGPVEDAADKMLAQLLEERSRRNCRFSFHGEGLIGLMRWGSG